ncbi:MAG TPA: tripartite tricarboxylate transporter substrate binding protein, partial [Burkholderiales bacterium]|nr:tripartite tricarboxylate transporter substrate binding protein [Burkholderiales bacterium]
DHMVTHPKLALLLAAFALLAGSASAQQYPAGPMRIVVPFTPGGGTDILARLIAQKLNESWGQPVVVDNRPGAAGTVGTAFVAKAPGDGHTLLIVPAGYAGNPGLYKKLPYEHARDLAPVSWLASGPLVLVVHPSLPPKSVKELIAFARARPDEINYGSSGAGTLPHLSAELFISMSGIKMVHVPYKGAGAAVTDVMAGRVPVYFMNILQSLSLIKAGKLRALGVTTPERTPIAPDIPAIAEAGLKGYDMTNWYGLLVPAATPRDAIVKLNAEVVRILKLPELTNRLADDGMTVVASTPERFAQFLARETEKFTRVIEAAGIKGSL